MLPLGHSSAGFIISQLKKPKPNLGEILFIIISANIFDLDIIFLYIFNKPIHIHHRLASHTPFFGIIYLFLFFLFFKKRFSKQTYLLSSLAMFSHLFLDSLSYLIYPSIVNHQISWFYPFFDPQNIINNKLLNLSLTGQIEINLIKDYYLIQTPVIFFMEILLFIVSIFLLSKNYYKHDQKI